MKYFPLGLNLQQRHCLIVGGGEIGFRKARALADAGALITLVSPTAEVEFENWLTQTEGVWVRQGFDAASYRGESIARYALVVAATDDDEINAQVAQLCRAVNVPINVASNVGQGDALLPAIIDRDDMTIAIHSNGRSPTITRYIKRQLDAFLPKHLGRLSQWAELRRRQVHDDIEGRRQRQRFWQHILSGPVCENVLSGKVEAAEEGFQQHLAKAKEGRLSGQVFLVGAGPGDPELLTLKALKLIQQADVVLYDRLVSDDVMALLPETTEKIYVGKRRADHAVPQPEINQQLVDLAKQGLNVLRLKGGDPFIFGRGGEELELLAESDVPFQVVPGITAASGCSSYAGIPLTHRDHAQSVRFVAGHLKDKYREIDWQTLAGSNQTLVFYMGLSELPTICEKLQAHGASEALPAAIIEKGTLENQRIAVGTLKTLASIAQDKNFRAPTLVIVGTVVSLHDKLRWIDR